MRSLKVAAQDVAPVHRREQWEVSSYMERSAHVIGRPRARSRLVHTEPSCMPDLVQARRGARRFVAARWPELAEVEPVVTGRPRVEPDPALLRRVGLDVSELAAPQTLAYTFTFASERHTADGYRQPLVAVVTADSQGQIVKTSCSR